METGDHVMQHTYESLEHIEGSLLETGEQLIRFIARENASAISSPLQCSMNYERRPNIASGALRS